MEPWFGALKVLEIPPPILGPLDILARIGIGWPCQAGVLKMREAVFLLSKTKFARSARALNMPLAVCSSLTTLAGRAFALEGVKTWAFT